MKDNSLKNIKEKKSLFTQIARRLMQSLKFYEWHEFATGQEETWQQIEMRIQMYERVRMRKLLLYTASAAASLALLLGGSYLWLSQPEKTSTSLMARIVETPLPETSEKEILLITADDKKLNIENNVNVKYHQNGTITLNEKRVNQSPPQTEEYNQVIVPKGKRTNIIFADGTRIYVNSGSRVVYPTVFAKDKREIYVEGEVYLDVKRDENCPFFVKTNDLSIKVLGTSFNVCAYKEDAEATVVLVKEIGRAHV